MSVHTCRALWTGRTRDGLDVYCGLDSWHTGQHRGSDTQGNVYRWDRLIPASPPPAPDDRQVHRAITLGIVAIVLLVLGEIGHIVLDFLLYTGR